MPRLQGHFKSRVTARMELELHKGDPDDVSSFLEHLTECADYRRDESDNDICYDVPDQGDGMRLLVGS